MTIFLYSSKTSSNIQDERCQTIDSIPFIAVKFVKCSKKTHARRKTQTTVYFHNHRLKEKIINIRLLLSTHSRKIKSSIRSSQYFHSSLYILTHTHLSIHEGEWVTERTIERMSVHSFFFLFFSRQSYLLDVDLMRWAVHHMYCI